jgi:hypothetical protein
MFVSDIFGTNMDVRDKHLEHSSPTANLRPAAKLSKISYDPQKGDENLKNRSKLHVDTRVRR